MDDSNSTNPKIPLILRARELEYELLEVNGTLSSWLIHYCDNAGIPIPDRAGLYYLIKRTTEILDELKQLRTSSTESKHDDDYRQGNRTF